MISQGEIGTVVSVDEDGDALIDFPTYEDESVWVQMDNFDKIAKIIFDVGDAIVVSEDFLADDEQPLSLLKYQGGVVEQVEDNGDLLVNFYDHDTMAWVFRDNFRRISRISINAAD